MSDDKTSLEGALPIPWQQNPLAVFGFTLEMVRGLQDRPQTLPVITRTMKRALMLAHHPDHTGSEQKAQDLNEAQGFIENPYWQRTIINQFLVQTGSLGSLQHKELEQLRGKLNEFAKELVKLKRKDEQRREEMTSQQKSIWLAAYLPTCDAMKNFSQSHQLLPHCLPSLIVLDRGGDRKELFLVDEEHRIRQARQPRKWATVLAEAVQSLATTAVKSLALKDNDSQICSIRAGLRAACSSVEATINCWIADRNMAEINKFRRYRWWPAISCRPSAFAPVDNWRRWGEMYGRELLGKELMGSKLFREDSKFSEQHLLTIRDIIVNKLQLEEQRYRIDNAGLQWLFSNEKRDQSKKLLLDKLSQGFSGRFVLGSLSGQLPTGSEFDTAGKYGISLGDIPLTFPTLSPTLMKDRELLVGFSPEQSKLESGQLPRVKLEIAGRILYSISLEQVFLGAEMRLLPV